MSTHAKHSGQARITEAGSDDEALKGRRKDGRDLALAPRPSGEPHARRHVGKRGRNQRAEKSLGASRGSQEAQAGQGEGWRRREGTQGKDT